MEVDLDILSIQNNIFQALNQQPTIENFDDIVFIKDEAHLLINNNVVNTMDYHRLLLAGAEA
jgi:hypothetical protein